VDNPNFMTMITKQSFQKENCEQKGWQQQKLSTSIVVALAAKITKSKMDGPMFHRHSTTS